MNQPPEIPPGPPSAAPPTPQPPNVSPAAPQGKPATPVRMRRNRPTGGTTLEEERQSSWIWAALLLVAGIAVIVVFSTRDKAEDAAEEQAAQVEERSAPDDEPAATGPTESAAAAEPDVAPVARVDAMRSFGDELNRVELWSEVELEDDNVTLRATTAYCEDPKFKATLKESQDLLKSEGITGVACYARYGKLMFEESL